jgi:thiamine transporter ThiT
LTANVKEKCALLYKQISQFLLSAKPGLKAVATSLVLMVFLSQFFLEYLRNANAFCIVSLFKKSIIQATKTHRPLCFAMVTTLKEDGRL